MLTSCDSFVEKKIIGKWENKDLERIANVACQQITRINFKEDFSYECTCKYTPLYFGEYVKIGCLSSYYSNSITLRFEGTWKIQNGDVVIKFESNNTGLNFEELGFEGIEKEKLTQITDSIMILDDTKFKRIQ